MDTPNTQKNDLEVMGVSRSGRVRKKSSKLMDFQSPDDIETRHKKASAKQKHAHANTTATTNSIGLGSTETSTSSQQQINVQNNNTTDVNNPIYSHAADLKSDDDQLSSIEDFIGEDNDENFDSDIDIEDISAIIDESIDDEDNDESGQVNSAIKRSIYMTEKINKKKILKDGKIVHSKAQRKDKGKSRFTAYMLWARDARQQMLTQQPDLDFATISRRLGEMWANVPAAEKAVLKRRAKRLATRTVKNRNDHPQNIKDITNIKTPTKFLNKGTTGSKSGKKSTSSSSHLDVNNQQQIMNIEGATINLAITQSQSSKTGPIITPGIYKVTGVEPLDVAAHLKLLGDSLTIIGERLKEHEGQIAVSGSLSVLLDSLLCSLGPLMCLTTQIHGLNEKNNNRLKDSLRNTLDNIAYVMPGL